MFDYRYGHDISSGSLSAWHTALAGTTFFLAGFNLTEILRDVYV